MALEVADLNGYCYGSQDFSPVVWRRLPSLRFSMLVGRRIICPQALAWHWLVWSVAFRFGWVVPLSVFGFHVLVSVGARLAPDFSGDGVAKFGGWSSALLPGYQIVEGGSGGGPRAPLEWVGAGGDCGQMLGIVQIVCVAFVFGC